jgi:uncharacterized protein
VIRGELACSAFSDLEEKQFTMASPVRYELKAQKMGDRVRIEGSVHGSMGMACGRCLDEFSYPINSCLDIELAPAELAPQATELELRSDDLDLYYFEGDEIDVDPFIYDEVLLNVPLRPLCREDCAGLCPTCGLNRNNNACSCDQAVSTVLGEKLKSFLTKQGD